MLRVLLLSRKLEDRGASLGDWAGDGDSEALDDLLSGPGALRLRRMRCCARGIIVGDCGDDFPDEDCDGVGLAAALIRMARGCFSSGNPLGMIGCAMVGTN